MLVALPSWASESAVANGIVLDTSEACCLRGRSGRAAIYTPFTAALSMGRTGIRSAFALEHYIKTTVVPGLTGVTAVHLLTLPAGAAMLVSGAAGKRLYDDYWFTHRGKLYLLRGSGLPGYERRHPSLTAHLAAQVRFDDDILKRAYDVTYFVAPKPHRKGATRPALTIAVNSIDFDTVASSWDADLSLRTDANSSVRIESVSMRLAQGRHMSPATIERLSLGGRVGPKGTSQTPFAINLGGKGNWDIIVAGGIPDAAASGRYGSLRVNYALAGKPHVFVFTSLPRALGLFRDHHDSRYYPALFAADYSHALGHHADMYFSSQYLDFLRRHGAGETRHPSRLSRAATEAGNGTRNRRHLAPQHS